MGWTRNDDRMPFHRKWLGLSNDAYAMGHRAMVWARSPEAHARPGFVTERELRKLSGGLSKRKFEAALQELVDAGAPAHEHGILERVEGGFEVHDFDQYGPGHAPLATPPRPPGERPKLDRSEAARVAGQASAARRRELNGTAQPNKPPRTSPNVAPERLERQAPNAQSQPDNFVPDSPEPDPDRSTTNVQDTEAERVERSNARTVVVGIREGGPEPELTECPPDLFERAQGGGVLQLLAHELDLDVWDVEAAALEFVDYWRFGRGAHGRERDWLGKLRQRVIDRNREGRVRGMGNAPGYREHRERRAREQREAEAPARPPAKLRPAAPPAPLTPDYLEAVANARGSVLGEVGS